MTGPPRFAVVQPQTYLRLWGRLFSFPFDSDAPPESQNLDDALEWVEKTADAGARYVAFPELYPGPAEAGAAFSLDRATEALAAQARRCNVWVLFGGAEAAAGGMHNTYNVVSPDGALVARYRKMIPACGEPWLPGREPVVVQAGELRIGLAICWEAWFPEVARALARQGADVIVFPTGAMVYELADRWQRILAARASENIVYTAASVNLLGVEAGMSLLCSPEATLAQGEGIGMALAEVDTARLAYLRTHDEELTVPKKYRSIPGLWRALTPEVSKRLIAASRG